MEPIKEYKIAFSLVDPHGGFLTTTRRRFYPSARETLEFARKSLDPIDCVQATDIALFERECGSWRAIDLLELEADAASDGDALDFNFDLRWRDLDENGNARRMHWQRFSSPRAAHAFRMKLDAPNARQAVGITIGKRSVGPWRPIGRADLERAAVEEGGGADG